MTNVACAEGTTHPVKLWQGPSTMLSMVSSAASLPSNSTVMHELCQQCFKDICDSALSRSNPFDCFGHAGHQRAFQPHHCSFMRVFFITAISASRLLEALETNLITFCKNVILNLEQSVTPSITRQKYNRCIIGAIPFLGGGMHLCPCSFLYCSWLTC